MVSGIFACFMLVLIVMGLVHLYNSDFFNDMGKENISTWSSAFECGFLAHSMVFKSFSRGFFILLVFFVIFDLEMSLLLKAGYVAEMFKSSLYYLSFLLMVCLGFLFEAEKGFMRWEK